VGGASISPAGLASLVHRDRAVSGFVVGGQSTERAQASRSKGAAPSRTSRATTSKVLLAAPLPAALAHGGPAIEEALAAYRSALVLLPIGSCDAWRAARGVRSLTCKPGWAAHAEMAASRPPLCAVSVLLGAIETHYGLHLHGMSVCARGAYLLPLAALSPQSLALA
jgi:hypothetical protein